MSNTSNRDLAPERQAKIAQMLHHHRVLRVSEICDVIGVSPASVRRDLADMERRGLLTRVHGGAMANENQNEEPLFDDKTGIAAEEKARIARAALDFIHPDDTIFLDGGSTVLALADLLDQHGDIAVVTNSLRVASKLSGSGPRVIAVGGELRRRSQTFVGSLTRHLIENLHVDTAFMGTIGLSPEDGLTTTDPREALTKELIMTRARRVVLLADSSKIGTVSFVEFGSLDAVQVLITDKGATTRDLEPFEERGVSVEQA